MATLTKLTLIWSEFNEDENVVFQSFEDLQTWFRKAYVNWLDFKTEGYYKNMLEIEFDGRKRQCRIDVSGNAWDFNPFRKNIKDYMLPFLEDCQIDRIDINEV